MPEELFAISPLDGRYAAEMQALRDYFSEFALIKGRIRLETAYLIALSSDAGVVRPLTSDEREFLRSISETFSPADALQVKAIEGVSRHDLKAAETYLRQRLAAASLSDVVEYLHFGLTSEDVNNLVLAECLRGAREHVLLPPLDSILSRLTDLVRAHKSTPMLAHTHGQPAVPTTLGKQVAVFLARLKRQRRLLARHQFDGKLNGAVGDFNALSAAVPNVDWPAFSARFVRSLNLDPSPLTTQVLPYDNWLEFFRTLMQINNILTGLVQDLWLYLSMGYMNLRAVPSEIGSSTMPQKVNPIDFENAEGNFGVANALMEFYARKLPISRLQRDLSDSTVRRTFGTALGHSLVGYRSLARGLEHLEVDEHALRHDLDAHWEVIAEGAQTILRAAGVSDPYDLLRGLTRGKGLTQAGYERWVDELRVDGAVKARLRWLSPMSYTGLAEQLADAALKDRSS